MEKIDLTGWRKLLDGYPWFAQKGSFPLSAYSEFMPPPRLGKRPCGEEDFSLFPADDNYGWNISEIEEEYELQPGLANLAQQIGSEIVDLSLGKPAYRICGHQGCNLVNNPYWSPELAQAGRLPQEKLVFLLPLALAKTQDDRGRQRWTFFGSSEQGPETAIWQSFYSSPNQEYPPPEALSFWINLLATIYAESCHSPSDLHHLGFRIFPTSSNSPYQRQNPLPASIQPFLWTEEEPLELIRFLLTFTPFSLLPEAVRRSYLSGSLVLLPFPGSLVFWGMPDFMRLQKELPLAVQVPLQRLVARHGGPEGLKVPQSGWFHETGRSAKLPEVHERLLTNTYKRTSRWDRSQRYENEVILSTIEDTIAKTLFSTELDVLNLYGKPMARNCQVWSLTSKLLLNGPEATREDLERAAAAIVRGGTFHYRFEFPPMQVGLHQVYWHRPLAACWNWEKSQAFLLNSCPTGYLTAYNTAKIDLANPISLWPRIQKRESYLLALHNFDHVQEHYRHQTVWNIIRLLDLSRRWGQKPVPRSLAREVLRLPELEPLEDWLAALPEKGLRRDAGDRLRNELESHLEPASGSAARTAWPGMPAPTGQPPALTYHYSAKRAFEEAWWKDIFLLSQGRYTNKNNADCVKDPPTLAQLTHRSRDLELLGDYLIQRHQQSIEAAGMAGQAICGELSFHWYTDFDFAGFGGWQDNQAGHKHERDLLVIIPGKNRQEAIIMADHYDTAYREDLYDKSRGGTGARIAAAGADDNCSASATLLQASPIFLEMSRLGLLERDVWLVHLTGEEFPADCLGSRRLCQSLVEQNLLLHLPDKQQVDLSRTRVAGVFLLDMVAHNRDTALDTFQISPGRGRTSLRLAYQAHLANIAWNAAAGTGNQSPERRGKGRSRHSPDGNMIPPTVEYPRLQGEVRLIEDPHSSLYNTDGQIFSDCGIPVVLFMENYDIKRSGYHDSKDNLAGIDLDYGSALAAIAIEATARAATQPLW